MYGILGVKSFCLSPCLTACSFSVEGDASICSSCSESLVLPCLRQPLNTPNSFVRFCMRCDTCSLFDRPDFYLAIKSPKERYQKHSADSTITSIPAQQILSSVTPVQCEDPCSVTCEGCYLVARRDVVQGDHS